MTTSSFRRRRLLYASLASFVLIVFWVGLANFGVWDGGVVALLIYAPQHGFAVLPLILALVALIQRRFKIVALNAVALLLWAQWLMGWNVPLNSLNPFSGEQNGFRVMTYNVQRGERGVAGLMEVIAAQRPDILCLQETQDPPPGSFSFPGKQLKTRFRNWNTARGGDVMTLSRFPLLSQRTWPLSGTRRILETVWQTPRGKIRVLNVHITKSLAERRLQERNWSAFTAQLGANARGASQIRLEQLPALHWAIESEPNLPLIVAGDFNSPPRGRFYRSLNARLSDAWKQGGWGALATFPSRTPLFGIDHIFLRGAKAKRAWTPPSRASDHLPLVAEVVLEAR